MTAAATYINTTIAGNATISAFIGNRLYWELAPADAQYPYADFSINQTPGRTKDSEFVFSVDIRVFDKTIKDSALILDAIINELKTTNPRWRFVNATSGYTDTDAKVGYVQVTYQFNL